MPSSSLMIQNNPRFAFVNDLLNKQKSSDGTEKLEKGQVERMLDCLQDARYLGLFRDRSDPVLANASCFLLDDYDGQHNFYLFDKDGKWQLKYVHNALGESGQKEYNFELDGGNKWFLDILLKKIEAKKAT